MQCPNCSSHQFHRIKRVGFLEINIYPLFGLFPWKCSKCRSRHLLHERGKRHKKLESQT